jgi:hypothetical protein
VKKRKFNISQEIMEGASECLHQLACLSEAGTLCKIKKYEKSRVMFVRKKDHDGCPFAIPIGPDCVCTCPVRVEIFRKYQV